MNIKRYIRKPALLFPYLGRYGWFHWIPDETYLRIVYKIHFGAYPDLEHPKTFNEKLQWLKLHDRKPEYTRMVDKYEAKKYISDIIGETYVVPTIGIWDSFDEIDFHALPDQFVLKCTHDSGGLVICRDKAKLDKAKIRRKINRCMKRNYYWAGREWPYNYVKPRIIAEPYMEETNGSASDQVDANNLTDYKFFCFNGVPKVMYIAKERSKKQEIDFFDMDFQHLPFWTAGDYNALTTPSKPKYFEKMKEIAAVLSHDIPHLRVDFYSVGEKLYVGELTFYHMSGTSPISPKEWDHKLGDWIELPK